MKTHERLFEDYEDACFALLMEKIAKQEGERLEALNRDLLDDPDFEVSEAVNEKCLRTISKCFSHQKRQTTFRKASHILRIAAIIAAIAVAVFTTAIAISEDCRIAARNLVISVNERYTDFRMEVTGQDEHSPALNNKDGAYFERLEIGWIPEGFQISKSEYNHWVFYENGGGEWIQILFADEDSTIQLDTENADVSDSNIAGLPAVVIEKDGRTTILLTDTEHGFFYIVIASQGVGFETATRIAENLIMS